MISFEEVDTYLRKLAKSTYWQTVYGQAREVNGITLFKNNTDFSTIQIDFLNNLGFYYSLLFDIAYGDVGEIVLDNFIYEDAYYEYRRQEKTKKKNKAIAQKEERIPHKDNQEMILNKNQWVFTKVKGK